MTKGELIKALEPFSDEIEVLIPKGECTREEPIAGLKTAGGAGCVIARP